MKLFTKSYYNPYFVDFGDKEFCLDGIYVFDENGVIAKNNCGWFGSNNNVPVRVFDCDCVKKLKVDFKCKTAFIVKDNTNTWSSESRYVLYLPAEVVKLSDPVTIKENDYTLRTTRKSTVYDGVYFETRRFLNAHLCVLQHEYQTMADKIQHAYYPDEKNILAIIDELKAKVEEYLAEKERITSLSIEEALKEEGA